MNFERFLRPPFLKQHLMAVSESTEVRKSCLRLRIIRRSAGIMISHVAGAVFYIW